MLRPLPVLLQAKLVVTVEGGVIAGGAGEGVLGELARQGLQTPALNLGIQDTFVPQGKTDLLLHDLGLDAEGIAASIQAFGGKPLAEVRRGCRTWERVIP